MQSIHPLSIGLGFATATSVVNVLASVLSKKALAGNNLFAATFWIRLFAAAVFTIAFLWHVHTAGPLHFVNDTELPLGPYVSRLPALAELEDRSGRHGFVNSKGAFKFGLKNKSILRCRNS